MLENPDFEQHFYSRTAIDIYKIGHDSIRIVKWLAYYDRSYDEKMNHYDLMGSVRNCLHEISQRSLLRRSKRSSISSSSNGNLYITKTRSTQTF